MKKMYLLLCTPLLFAACSSSNGTSSNDTFSDSNDETAQQVGDAMASVDESGGASGSIAMNKTIEKTFQRLAPGQLQDHSFMDMIIQPAFATSCFSATTFGLCSSNVRTHTFDGCKVGAATFEGTATLTWAGAGVSNCRLGAAGDSITRDPEFTVMGLRGATMTVSKTGTDGQVMTWDSGTAENKVFLFTNDGIKRKFTLGSDTLFDFTTTTTAAVTVTGTLRSNRVMDGGKLKVENNKTGKSCTFVPSAVTWDKSTCNCATSGTWTGTCEGGKTTTVDITGCGTANVTIGDATGSVTFDRCVNL